MKRARLAGGAGLALLVAALLTCLAGCKKGTDEQLAAEIATREAYARRVLLEEDAGRALGVSSTSEIMFDEGFSQISYDPPEQFRAHAFRWMGQNAHVRLKRRGEPMRLHMQGWVNMSVIKAKPSLAAYVDGQLVATSTPDDGGHYWIDVVVPPSMLGREWVDLNVRLNAVGFHWSDPPVLMVALTYNFAWTPAADAPR